MNLLDLPLSAHPHLTLHGPPIRPMDAAERLANANIRGKFKLTALHAYTDTKGRPVCWRIRARLQDGAKWIRPMTVRGMVHELREPEFLNGKKPLYRLHEVARADAGQPVWFVEGENCADAVTELGLLTTTAGSASSDERVDLEPLRHRTVILWPDEDEPGHAHMQRIAQRLQALGCTVEVIDARALGLFEHGDVIDYLAAHPNATADDLMLLPRLADSSATVEPLSASGDTWPDPAPLPSELPSVSAFDPALLPDSLRALVEDIADRVQCPIDFPAVALMVALGSVLGRKVAVLPKRFDSWYEVPNLWGAIVGNPGVLKSPALTDAMRPLRELEKLALDKHNDERRLWERRTLEQGIKRGAAKHKATQAARSGKEFDVAELQSGDEDEPTLRRYIVNDTSVEALGEVLRANSNGTLAYRDELAGLLRSLDKEGNEGARAFYLTAWNGKEPFVFDRIGRGLNLRIDALCVALLGSIQPAVLAEYLREATRGCGADGLMARFSLLVWPDVSREWRNVDRAPNASALDSVRKVFRHFSDLAPADVGAAAEFGDLHALRFDSEAQACFDEWRERFERGNRAAVDLGEHAALVAHRDKYRKLVPVLALLSHLADKPTGGPIGTDSLLRAMGWRDYLDSHARRAYASVTRAEADGARELLRRIVRGEVADGFRVRDIYVKGWARLGKPSEATRATELLSEFDYLKEERETTGGRPTVRHWINPKAKTNAASNWLLTCADSQ